jgi:hypothetical protein
MRLSVKKTKVMVFSRRKAGRGGGGVSNQAGRAGEPLIWHGEPLEEVDSFSYLGIEVGAAGSFGSAAAWSRLEPRGRAGLSERLQHLRIFHLRYHLDALVESVAECGCEVRAPKLLVSDPRHEHALEAQRR